MSGPRMFRRQRREPMPAKFQPLADYNNECAHGIVHTPEWDEQMRVLQGEFLAWHEDAKGRGK